MHFYEFQRPEKVCCDLIFLDYIDLLIHFIVKQLYPLR